MREQLHRRIRKHSNQFNRDEDFEYALELCRWLLKPLGIWWFIYSKAKRTEKVLSILLMIMCFASLMFLLVPVSCHLLLEDLDARTKIKLIGPTCNCSLSVIKYCYLVFRGKTFVRFIGQVENDWRMATNRHHRVIMLKQACFSRNLIMLCIIFIYSANISYLMIPLSMRRATGNATVKVLAYPGYNRFFDVQSSPTYEILYFGQCFVGFVRHGVTIASFSLVVVFVTHICGQMQIQLLRLEELNCEAEEKDSDRDPLGDIIRNHTEILRFTKKVGNAFSEIIFMEVIGSTFLMCMSEYCFLLEWANNNTVAITTYIVYMISFSFIALIFCCIGEILTDQCSQIGHVSYEINWYNLPPKKAHSLVLLNAISQYPPKLTGGKITVLSLNTFSLIVKSSVVYLNVLRTMTYKFPVARNVLINLTEKWSLTSCCQISVTLTTHCTYPEPRTNINHEPPSNALPFTTIPAQVLQKNDSIYTFFLLPLYNYTPNTNRRLYGKPIIRATSRFRFFQYGVDQLKAAIKKRTQQPYASIINPFLQPHTGREYQPAIPQTANHLCNFMPLFQCAVDQLKAAIKKGTHATCIGASSVTLHNQFPLVPLGEQSLPSFPHVNTMRTPVVREQSADRPRNPNYKKDIVHILKHPRWILRSIGIWPTFLEDDNGILPKLVIGLCNLTLLFTVVPFIFYITLEEQNIEIKMKLLGLLSYSTVSVLKYWALTACKPRLKHCIVSLENDWKEVKHHEDREFMLKYGNVGRSLTMLCMGFMYTGGFMFHTVLQFAGGTQLDEWNRTVKPLIYPVYSGMYNPQESPVYEMVYVAHCMCGYVTHSATVATCGLAATFATHVCGQVEVIMLKLKNLVDFESKADLDRGMIQIVKHHTRTLRLSAMTEALLQEVCFLEFLGSTFNICLIEYYIIMDWGTNMLSFVTYFALLTSLMFNIFILCYIGDLLVEKTGKVGISCFMIDWYKFPNETIRGLILIIVRSSNPAKISAGKIAVLDLSTFANILKTSLGYLSLLRTVV
ncbi:uncharacterized protein LOC143174608 [Nomia melanderi]|uniref:uncharacterized protein LOC143174608 n=1 Tax=Nomia melanderi TaxID=2448451 RepID=UPI003FCDD8F8